MTANYLPVEPVPSEVVPPELVPPELVFVSMDELPELLPEGLVAPPWLVLGLAELVP